MSDNIDFFTYCDLIEKLNEWTEAYEKGEPVVSDAVYDEEYKKLKRYERTIPNEEVDSIPENSPTQKVGAAGVTGTKVTHDIPMLSIANSMSPEELEEWSKDKAGKGCAEQTIEYKIDGLALALKYEDGELVDAVTRGNGAVGDCVYANALRIDDIPKTIPLKHITEIRGECVWLKEDFEKYNEKLEAMGKEPMSNPRNGAAGTMKSKDPNDVTERKLSFVAYSVVAGSENDTHEADLKDLKTCGFIVSEYYVCPNPLKVVAGAAYMEKKRHEQPFLIDGLVIKVNDKTTYKRLGGTSKTPHFCTALKFPPEEKVTKLLGIEHSYGRTGAVTPVAILEEIELALTKVRRASLHNWDMAEYLGCHVGCSVVVRKAGEIIPEIVKVVEIGRTKDDYEKALYDKVNINTLTDSYRIEDAKDIPNIEWYIRPTVCEHCGSTLCNDTNRDGEKLVAWVCPNSACSVKQYKQIVKFVAKEAMNIMGVGESLIEALLSKGLIKNVADLYKLTKDDLLTLDSVKERSAEKAIDAITESRKAYLNNLLAGIGIPNLGKTMSGPIAETFVTLEAVSKATVSEIEDIEGIGNELAESVVEWFQNQDNMDMIQYFIDNNIASEAKPSVKKSDKLKGITLIMTGKFDDLGRGEFKDLVAEHGGNLASGISKNVNYVLMGDGAGPAKSKKINDLQAQGIDIKVIGSQDFLKMLED